MQQRGRRMPASLFAHDPERLGNAHPAVIGRSEPRRQDKLLDKQEQCQKHQRIASHFAPKA
jgi:hypothetical protein